MSTRTGSLDFGSRSSIENVILDNRTTDPSVVAAGLFYYNTVTGYIRYCNGGAWMNVEHQSNRVNVWSDVPSTIKYPSEKLTKESLDTISLALSTHNHNLNDLAEKSYDSLTDKPSLNFEPADANIQLHIGDGNIHVTKIKTAAWDAKLDVSTVIPSLDTIDKRLTPAINEVNAIAKGAGNGETITDIEALVILLNAAVPTDYPYGKNFYVVDTEVPDYWISAIGSSSVPYVYVDDTTFLDDIAVTGSLQVGYYSISELEGQKVDLTDYYDKAAADLLLGAKEDITNKSSNVDTDKTSTTKYANVKAIYDWATGLFATITNLNTKADIAPANGSTSALRALFIARGYDAYTNTYHCVYNSNTGFYEMNGLTDLTEAEMLDIYNASIPLKTIQLVGACAYVKVRTLYPLYYFPQDYILMTRFCLGAASLITVKSNEYNITNALILTFFTCTNLVTFETLNIVNIVSAGNIITPFLNCTNLTNVKLKGLKVAFTFASSPLLSLESLQYLVNNRANGNNQITITVHATVLAKLTSTDPQYADWNDLLVDAMDNQHINFAS